MAIEIRTITGLDDIASGSTTSAINVISEDKSKLIRRSASSICFELSGVYYWASPVAWKARRSSGYIEVFYGLKVGQEVRMRITVSVSPSGLTPGGIDARAGAKMIVSSLSPKLRTFPIYVVHKLITGRRPFGVTPDEIAAA
jgi:hypothetical protein